jgi:hypothetical protein
VAYYFASRCADFSQPTTTTTLLFSFTHFVSVRLKANYAPASAYLTYATHPNDRTTVMIANSAASILGFILGPGALRPQPPHRLGALVVH